MAQQQMFSLEALANRGNAPALPAAPAPGGPPAAAPVDQRPLDQQALLKALRKEFSRAA
jgi:hypothetical protein